jgi:predicted SnoaL-like aldol condensation-catalyzing enzyme
VSDGVAANRKLVTEFIQAFYNDKDFDHAKSLLTEDFVNHHPGVGVGRERTVSTFRQFGAEPYPDFHLTVRRMVAEGDYVWTHSLVKASPEAPDVVVVDIWRIAGGLLAEHWDVGQPVPAESTVEDMLGGPT